MDFFVSDRLNLGRDSFRSEGRTSPNSKMPAFIGAGPFALAFALPFAAVTAFGAVPGACLGSGRGVLG